MTQNADYVGHPVFAATWNAPNPWPICLECGGRVYVDTKGWHHFNPFVLEDGCDADD